MNKDKVTIHDVARAANVSPATVSRVLNNSDHPVKPELKEKILLASKQLGYIPNLQARNLKSKKKYIYRDHHSVYCESILSFYCKGNRR